MRTRSIKYHQAFPLQIIQDFRLINEWKKTEFLENSPQKVKQKVFLKYGVPDAIWVETGTFTGKTTDFLAKRYPHVHSIEPEKDLFDKAVKRFSGRNVTLYNNVSEIEMHNLLPGLERKCKFLA